MNRLPIIGWLLSFLINVSLAIPFWLIWTVFGVGSMLSGYIPDSFVSPGFWTTVGLFICIEIIRTLIFPRRVFDESKDD